MNKVGRVIWKTILALIFTTAYLGTMYMGGFLAQAIPTSSDYYVSTLDFLVVFAWILGGGIMFLLGYLLRGKGENDD